MDAVANVYPDGGVIGIGVLLALKGLDDAGAVPVLIIDNPGLPKFALFRHPFPFPDRHGSLLCSRWQHVAQCRIEIRWCQGLHGWVYPTVTVAPVENSGIRCAQKGGGGNAKGRTAETARPLLEEALVALPKLFHRI